MRDNSLPFGGGNCARVRQTREMCPAHVFSLRSLPTNSSVYEESRPGNPAGNHTTRTVNVNVSSSCTRALLCTPYFFVLCALAWSQSAFGSSVDVRKMVVLSRLPPRPCPCLPLRPFFHTHAHTVSEGNSRAERVGGGWLGSIRGVVTGQPKLLRTAHWTTEVVCTYVRTYLVSGICGKFYEQAC